MRKIILIAVLLCCNSLAYTQSKNKEYTQLPGGVEYKLLHDEPGTETPQIGNYLGVNLYVEVEGKEIYNSREANKGQTFTFFLSQSNYKTDIQEVIKLMTAGDSVAIRMSVDSMLTTPAPKEPWMKAGTGQKVTYTVKLLSFKNLQKK